MQLEQVGFCSIKLHKFPVELRKTRDRDFVGRLRRRKKKKYRINFTINSFFELKKLQHK